MRVLAFVGKSGTGKSYHSMEVAKNHNIDAILDDGLLIIDNKIIAGKSAKQEKNRMASVRRAILLDNLHAAEIKQALSDFNISSILIIGTSEKMVSVIAEKLDVLPIEKTIFIEDIASPTEIETASFMRETYGQHVIPVPTLEVKRRFSGYLINPLRLVLGKAGESAEKTVIRPTYSYLGEFKISPQVICDICRYEISKLQFISQVLNVKTFPLADGYMNIGIDVSLYYPCNIPEASEKITRIVSSSIDYSTSIIVKKVFVSIKTLTI